MSRHASEAVLSAYLDDELSPERTHELESHLRSCSSCRDLMVSMRRVVGELRALERQAPSPVLGPGIVRRIRLEGPPRGALQRLEARLDRIRLESPTLLLFAMVVAFALLLVVFTHGIERFAHRTRLVVPASLEQVVVSGHHLHRVEGRWVEAGRDRAAARAVRADSEEGRAILQRLPALEGLLADGPVVLELDPEGLVELEPAPIQPP